MNLPPPQVCSKCGSKDMITTSKGPRCRECGEPYTPPKE